jgi:hypothetical protein
MKIHHFIKTYLFLTIRIASQSKYPFLSSRILIHQIHIRIFHTHFYQNSPFPISLPDLSQPLPPVTKAVNSPSISSILCTSYNTITVNFSQHLYSIPMGTKLTFPGISPCFKMIVFKLFSTRKLKTPFNKFSFFIRIAALQEFSLEFSKTCKRADMRGCSTYTPASENGQ